MCNGNCNQGRACDCVANVEIDEPDDRLSPGGLLAIVLCTGLAFWAVMAAIAVAAWNA